MAGDSTPIKRLVVMSGSNIICCLREASDWDKPTLNFPFFCLRRFNRALVKVCQGAKETNFSPNDNIASIDVQIAKMQVKEVEKRFFTFRILIS